MSEAITAVLVAALGYLAAEGASDVAGARAAGDDAGPAE